MVWSGDSAENLGVGKRLARHCHGLSLKLLSTGEEMHVSAQAPRPAMAVPQGFALLLDQQVMATSCLDQIKQF